MCTVCLSWCYEVRRPPGTKHIMQYILWLAWTLSQELKPCGPQSAFVCSTPEHCSAQPCRCLPRGSYRHGYACQQIRGAAQCATLLIMQERRAMLATSWPEHWSMPYRDATMRLHQVLEADTQRMQALYHSVACSYFSSIGTMCCDCVHVRLNHFG